MTLHDEDLVNFIRESNRIEGIYRGATADEIEASEGFLALSQVGVLDLDDLVDIYQPGAALRDKPGMDVRVGRYVAPPGGPDIVNSLEAILRAANGSDLSPHQVHLDYETLHPFLDGNGRSGRMLWAWMMRSRDDDPGDWLRRGFLHSFYYQALTASRD